MDSPTAQMDSSPSPPSPLSQRLSSLKPLWEKGSKDGGERVFEATLALWCERLTNGWTPPENPGFPWAQVKRSLAALVAEPSTLSPREAGEGVARNEPGEGTPPVLALICAGNTPLLAWPAMLFAVKHGVPIFVKMSRDETLWPQLLKESVAEVDPEAGARIICEVWPGEDPRTEELIQQADAVIAYGSDATIERLKTLSGKKPFLGFGHAISIGIAIALPKKEHPGRDEATWADFANDILTFDQQGCLSPHVIFCHRTTNRQWLLDVLAKTAEKLDVPMRTDFEEAALVRSWRTMTVLQGARVWGDEALRWTVVDWPSPSPLNPISCPGLVQLTPYNRSLDKSLELLKGHISCVGLAGTFGSSEDDKRHESILIKRLEALGISRVCKAGEMQTPPLDWKNGGVDLEAWIANLKH